VTLFKLGEWVMEHVVTFVSSSVQLQTLLCYSHNYDIIFIPSFQSQT